VAAAPPSKKEGESIWRSREGEKGCGIDAWGEERGGASVPRGFRGKRERGKGKGPFQERRSGEEERVGSERSSPMAGGRRTLPWSKKKRYREFHDFAQGGERRCTRRDEGGRKEAGRETSEKGSTSFLSRKKKGGTASPLLPQQRREKRSPLPFRKKE